MVTNLSDALSEELSTSVGALKASTDQRLETVLREVAAKYSALEQILTALRASVKDSFALHDHVFVYCIPP